MKTKTSFAILLLILLMSGVPLMAQDTTRTSQPAIISHETPPPDFVPVDKEPQIINSVIPYYPELAQKAGIEGRVILKIWISKEGKPVQALVLKSTAKVFDRPAVEAAMKYRFTPAMFDNKPVGVWVVIPFTFKLKKAPEPVVTAGAKLDTRVDYLILQDAVQKYNAAMQYENARQYEKAAAVYREFLKQVKNVDFKPEEMIRHAKMIVEKYEKVRQKSK